MYRIFYVEHTFSQFFVPFIKLSTILRLTHIFVIKKIVNIIIDCVDIVVSEQIFKIDLII